MAVQGERLLKTYKAAAAMGTNNVIVYQSAANQVTRAAGSGQMFCGVVENNAAINEAATVCFSGMTKVHAGTGAISRGDYLTCDARGYAVSTSNGLDYIIGTAEDASTADGQLIAINVNYGKLPS